MGKKRDNEGNPINFAQGNAGTGGIVFDNNDTGTLTLVGGGTITFGNNDDDAVTITFTSTCAVTNNIGYNITAGVRSPILFGEHSRIFSQPIVLSGPNNVSFPKYQHSDGVDTINIGNKKVLQLDILYDMRDTCYLLSDVKKVRITSVSDKVTVNTEECEVIKSGSSVKISNPSSLIFNVNNEVMLKILRLHDEMYNDRKSKNLLNTNPISTDDANRIYFQSTEGAGLSFAKIEQDILYALSLFTDNDCSVINNEDTSLDLAGETLNPDE